MLGLLIAKGARPTGQLLLELLVEHGISAQEGPMGADALVSYGIPVGNVLPPVPTLNANAGRRSKFEELEHLKASGILVPPFDRLGHQLKFPLLGRRVKHAKGRDIVPVLQNGVWLDRLINTGVVDFFTQFIPKDREFRVWSYRRRVLAVYEKVLKYPDKSRGLNIIWNWDSGYAFEFVREDMPTVKQVGANAVQAMGLDFGAVDMILGQDGMLYTLEVNSAPGVQDRRQGISKLADKIAKWVALGYPKRNGADDPLVKAED